jgi:hypothetical protein
MLDSDPYKMNTDPKTLTTILHKLKTIGTNLEYGVGCDDPG